MTSAARAQTSAQLARSILDAARVADLAELDRQLVVAEQLGVPRQASPGWQAEQAEVLGAAAGELRRSLGRFGRRLASDLEGILVPLRLLEHLATPPPSARRTPARRLEKAAGAAGPG